MSLSPFQKCPAKSSIRLVQQRTGCALQALASGLLNTSGMKTNHAQPIGHRPPTLADLIATVSNLTRNQRLAALVVADLINSGKVRIEGQFQNRQVVVG